jgi:hypothetical protein
MLALAGLMVLFVTLLILPAGLFASPGRDHYMTCDEVFLNMDGNFEFVFWYTYADNNWVKIYDMAGKEVFKIDMPYDNPHFVASLPNGMYAVKTFTVGRTDPIQTFLIGKDANTPRQDGGIH